MGSPIDILINAVWRGGSATGRAEQDLRNLGGTVSNATVELAAMQARSGLLQAKLTDLADKVAQGALTTDSARKAYNDYAGTLQSFEPVVKKTGITTAQLVKGIGAFTIAAGAATIAARKFFDALEAGAGLELTEKRFDRLALSIGSTGDVLRGNLIEATSGMVSSAESMALATDLVGLNLATTSDEVVRMARVVTELDQDLNELTQALANQSTRRLDQLGVSVVVFREKLEALSGTMSDEDAYRMAFLQAAEEQIDRVGGAADTTAGDIRRLQSDWNDLSDDLKRVLAQTFGPVLADASGRTSQELKDQATEAAGAADSVSDLQRAFNELNREAEALRQRDPAAFALFVKEGFNQANVELLTALANMTDSAEEFEREAVRIFGPQGFTQAIIESGARHAEAFYEMATSVDEHGDAMQRNDELMREHAVGMHRTIETYEELDVVIRAVNESLDQNAEALAAIEPFEARREGIDARSLVAEQGQEQLAADFQLLQDRTDLFIDFQADISDINQREEEQRLQIVEQYEERRTDLIESYNERRLQEEEDFQRRQTRQDAQLARDIADVQSDTAERQADLRADANRRLADLEEDHLDRMREITENADLALDEAASRLDARAVASIQRNRDRALQDEVDRYQDQREDILEELDRRLELEQEAAEERIAELQEFHERRQSEEEEDRRIRLQRMEQAHQDQLRELDKQEAKRIQQIRDAAVKERNERERQYTEDRFQLSDHLDDRAELERNYRNDVLRAEEEWWQQRVNLVVGGTTGSDTGGTDGSTGGDDGDDDDTGAGTHGADRYWMEHRAFMIANPQGTNAALAWQRYFRSLTDEQLAAWIEQHSDIDVPGFLHGGYVNGTGLAMLHGSSTEPEYVLDATTTRQAERLMGTQLTQAGLLGALQGSTNSTRTSFGDISIVIQEARRPGQTGEEVRQQLLKLIEEAA